MKLQLSEQEQRLFRSLSESSEGAVFTGYLKRLCAELTNTRNLDKNGDLGAELAGVEKASAIIEENLIGPLSRTQHHKGEPERFD